jgi:cytochrome P450
MSAPLHTPYAHELAWPAELTPFDAWDTSIQANPFPHYAWMRQHAPVLRTATPIGDVWFLSRYADVLAAFRAPDAFSSVLNDQAKLPVMLFLDPPDHNRLRELVAHLFRPKAIAHYEAQIRAIAQRSIESLLDRGSGEFVSDFAIPVSMGTITSILGLRDADFSRLREWAEQLSSYFGRITGRSPGSPGDEEGARALMELITRSLIDAEDDGSMLGFISRLWRSGTLTDEEAMQFGVLLFNAGHETTTILMSNGLVLLQQRPDIHRRLRDDPAAIRAFVEELARYRGTLQRLGRRTTRDVEVAGHVIPRHSHVRLLPGSANRDEAKFPDGETFDIDRNTSGHLGFGHGVHACLGAWLARLETRVVFELVTQNIERIDLDGPDAITPYAGGTMSNTGPRALDVRITPREVQTA